MFAMMILKYGVSSQYSDIPVGYMQGQLIYWPLHISPTNTGLGYEGVILSSGLWLPLIITWEVMT